LKQVISWLVRDYFMVILGVFRAILGYFRKFWGYFEIFCVILGYLSLFLDISGYFGIYTYPFDNDSYYYYNNYNSTTTTTITIWHNMYRINTGSTTFKRIFNDTLNLVSLLCLYKNLYLRHRKEPAGTICSQHCGPSKGLAAGDVHQNQPFWRKPRAQSAHHLMRLFSNILNTLSLSWTFL